MLYLWEMPECAQKFIADYNRELSPDRFLFRKGINLLSDQVNIKPVFELKVTRAEIIQYDCIPNISASPLVNQKIVDILLKLAPDDVQFFDAEVKCKDGILTDYKLLNATSKIKGIDRNKSICTMMKQAPDAILGFKYLTYKPGCMGSHKLARDEEYLGNFLVIDEVKQALEKEKIKGVWFVRPEDYYRPLTPEDIVD